MRKITGGTGIQYRRHLLAMVLLVGVCLGVLGACQPKLEARNNDARRAAMEWCRLAEFPSGRTNEQIVISGSSFTRGFEIWFTLTPSDLESWIRNSPGLQDASVETNGDGRTYLVKPKDAVYCLVRINEATGEIYIKTYWS